MMNNHICVKYDCNKQKFVFKFKYNVNNYNSVTTNTILNHSIVLSDKVVNSYFHAIEC